MSQFFASGGQSIWSFKNYLKKSSSGNSLVGQWLKLHTHHRGHGFDPWLGRKHPTSHTAQSHTQKKIKLKISYIVIPTKSPRLGMSDFLLALCFKTALTSCFGAENICSQHNPHQTESFTSKRIERPGNSGIEFFQNKCYTSEI